MDSSIIKFANKLELHYYFSDKSYYIDAQVKQRCEKEVISLIRLLADLMDSHYENARFLQAHTENIRP